MEKITVLGYEIENGRISPDKNRLQPLLDLAEPKIFKELKQVRGLFAYYAKWIAEFSTKIRPLIDTEVFALSTSARKAFETSVVERTDFRSAPLHPLRPDLSYPLLPLYPLRANFHIRSDPSKKSFFSL